MTKKIKIICDDVEYNLEMIDDKTILDIALENDIDAPYSCQGGICSTCLAKITKGTAKMDNNQILTDDEIADAIADLTLGDMIELEEDEPEDYVEETTTADGHHIRKEVH